MAKVEITHNIFQTKLFLPMLAGDTSMTLTTVSGLSTTNPFRLRIDDDPTNFTGTYEVVLCNGVNGATNVVTITSRGVDGTSAIPHGTGAPVTGVLTRGAMDAMFRPPFLARAYQNVAQSTPNNTLTKITLDTASYDPNSGWNLVVGNRWTCSCDGYYGVTARVQFPGASASGYLLASVQKNGSAVTFGPHTPFNTTASVESMVNDVLQLAAGDYLELFVVQTSGVAINTSPGFATVFMTVTWQGPV